MFEFGDFEIVHLSFANDVVLFLRVTLFDEEHHGGGDVARVNPKPRSRNLFLSVGMDDNLFARHHGTDDFRNKLFRMLPLSKYIHAVGDHDRKFVGVAIGQTEFFAAGLRRRIRVARVVAVPLFVVGPFWRRSKHLVCREVKELLKALHLASKI